MLLHELVATSSAVAATTSRTAKVAALAAAVAGLEDVELAAGLAFLAGHPRQDRLSVGWATVEDVDAAPAATATLTVERVDAVLGELADASGAGSQTARADALADLLASCTADEQAWLRGMLLRNVRQGASDSLVVSAVAAACDVPVGAVRRAVFLTDDPAGAALAARHGGEPALAALDLVPLRFARPMLASAAPDVRAAVSDLGDVVADVKLDGARVQVHRDGDEVRVFTRNGNDVTTRLPEVVAVARALDVDRVVLDGEAIALRADGSPRPFPETMGRFGTDSAADSTDGDRDDGVTPLSVFFFDVLAASGGAAPARDRPSVVDEPLTERLALLDLLVPPAHRVKRLRSSDPDEVAAFAQAAVDDRQEGVLLKDPAAPYAAGRRGSAWRKVKPVHTLDLVVLAVEWGSGRRRGWLSNLHLGAYDPDQDDWVMLGKTFKGLTDDMLTWQTEALLALEERRTSRVVHVRPGLVVEVALDGFVRSPRYPAGIALRFARVRQHRPDKDARQADTVATALGVFSGEVRPTLG